MVDSNLHVETLGSGHPVLFIHAGVADSRMWNGQFPEIEGFQLIRFDMRGYGQSGLGSEPFANADDAIAVLDSLDVPAAVIVGCSMGGNVALQLATLAPGRVDGLVLVGADAPGFDPGIDYQSPEWPDAVTAFQDGDLHRVAELEAEIWLAGRDRSTSDADPTIVELFIDMDLIALRNEEDRDGLESSAPLERLPDLDVPVRVIVGERDLPQLQAAAGHLAASLSDEPEVVISDSAHLPSMDRPGAFNRALTAFLAVF